MMLRQLEASLKHRPGARVRGMDDATQAAVALVIRPALDLIFIRRAENESDPWSGHMALPGGRVDPTDESPQAAARRETLEEVGIDLGGARLLGRMDQVASPALAPRVVVTPFVFVLEAEPKVCIDVQEVAAVHWFALQRLIEKEGRSSFDYRYGDSRLRLPCVDLDGQRIWGMTLRIVDELVERLMGQC